MSKEREGKKKSFYGSPLCKKSIICQSWRKISGLLPGVFYLPFYKRGTPHRALLFTNLGSDPWGIAQGQPGKRGPPGTRGIRDLCLCRALDIACTHHVIKKSEFGKALSGCRTRRGVRIMRRFFFFFFQSSILIVGSRDDEIILIVLNI